MSSSDNLSTSVLFHSSESGDDATRSPKRQRHDTSSSSSSSSRLVHNLQFHYDDISFSLICEYLNVFDLIIVSSLNKTFNKLQHPTSGNVNNWRHLPPLRISHQHKKENNEEDIIIKFEQLPSINNNNNNNDSIDVSSVRYLIGDKIPWSSLKNLPRLHFVYCFEFDDRQCPCLMPPSQCSQLHELCLRRENETRELSRHVFQSIERDVRRALQLDDNVHNNGGEILFHYQIRHLLLALEELVKNGEIDSHHFPLNFPRFPHLISLVISAMAAQITLPNSLIVNQHQSESESPITSINYSGNSFSIFKK